MAPQAQVNYNPSEDYYKLFGLSPFATAEEIQQAFRSRAKKVHPDLNPDRKAWANQQFQKINAAYDILSNPTLRNIYDRHRKAYFDRGAGHSSAQ